MRENISFIIIFHNNNYINYIVNNIISYCIIGDEIIIVNDHSILNLDQSILESKFVKIVEATQMINNRGYNRNLGASYSNNDILLFLDGDIFLDKVNLEKLYIHHKNNENKIIIPKVVGHSLNENQINFIINQNYLDLFKKQQNLEWLSQNYFLDDYRNRIDFDNIPKKFMWIYFISGCFMISKQLFYLVGEFDTKFKKWGCEDTDFGYRLIMYNSVKIAIDFEIYVFHLPHEKNYSENYNSNILNIKYFFEKYLSLEIELFLTYNISKKMMYYFEIFISQMQKIQVDKFKKIVSNNEITYDCISVYNTMPKISYIINNEIKEINSLLGVTLPFDNSYFERAFLNINIYLYPPILFLDIISEFFRISKRVYLCGKLEKNISWDAKLTNVFKSKSKFKKNATYLPIKYLYFKQIKPNLIEIIVKKGA